ncbi:MAG TPA: hypothetical protein VGI88_02810, partial [Verrucomicrobiae bacterium]
MHFPFSHLRLSVFICGCPIALFPLLLWRKRRFGGFFYRGIGASLFIFFLKRGAQQPMVLQALHEIIRIN